MKGLKNWPEAFYAFLNVAIKFQDKGIFEKDIVVNIADTYIEYSTFDNGTILSKSGIVFFIVPGFLVIKNDNIFFRT